MGVKTILVLCHDDRMGRKGGVYGQTAANIINLLNGWIDIHSWSIDQLKALRYHPILDEIDPGMNGRAYKPLAIAESLRQLDEGDFLIYNDVSPEIWANVEQITQTYTRGDYGYEFSTNFALSVIHSLTQQNNDILTAFVKWDYLNIPANGLGLHLHRYFTLDACINKMGMQAYRDSYQCASGMICIRKTPETVKLVDEWLYWNSDENCASLKNWEEEREFKVGHRHDQSILGLLLNQRNAYFVDIQYNEMNPYNFLQFCRPDVTYKFINGNQKPTDRELEFNKIFIRKGSKVQNQAGITLTVHRIDYVDGRERFIVGQHEESCYGAFREELTLVV